MKAPCQPAAGRVLVLGQSSAITWSLIADAKLWPSKKVKLELFFKNGKVGDIAEVPLDFAACPASGAYTWLVGKVTNVTDVSQIPDGKNLIPGNEYWIRASGDGSSYFGPQFVISGASHLPAPGSTPVHKGPHGRRERSRKAAPLIWRPNGNCRGRLRVETS